MKCPHCFVRIHSKIEKLPLGTDKVASWSWERMFCPACQKLIVTVTGRTERQVVGGKVISDEKESHRYYVIPRVSNRPPPPKEVPTKYSQDYIEASAILSLSPNASAALSRRCLQNLLRNEAKVTPSKLSHEIEAVIASGELPSYLSDSIDAIRNIGNFATHPMKDSSTGEIVAVEPGEAEWTLEVLDELFDFYFVKPKRLEAKKNALNAKLSVVNKPLMK